MVSGVLQAETLCDPIRYHLSHISLEVRAGEGEMLRVTSLWSPEHHLPWPPSFQISVLLEKAKLYPKRKLSASARLRPREWGSSVATEQALCKWPKSPKTEHQEGLVHFTLKNSIKKFLLQRTGRVIREALKCGFLLSPSCLFSPLPSFNSSRPVCRGCFSPLVPLPQVSHSVPQHLAALKPHRGKKVRETRAKSRAETKWERKRQIGGDREAETQREVETRKEIKIYLGTQRFGSRGDVGREAERKGQVNN